MCPDPAASELHVVTGGAGFIGSHLVDTLLAGGRRVRVIDDFSSGSPRRVADSAELMAGDVGELAREAVEGATIVYHLAAQVSVPRSVQDPLATHRATESATVAVLDAAERAGVRRVVLASSSAVYGNRPELPKREEDPPAPASPYAAAKLCSEIYAKHWAVCRRLETVSLRFFNVYGPRQDPQSPYAAAIPIFLSRLLEGRPLPVFGDGRQTRDFIYVDDVVRALVAAGRAPQASGRVFNIAGGTGISLLDLIDTMADLMGVRARIDPLPPRSGDIEHSRADISAAEQDLNFTPWTDLRTGLRETIAWYRQRLAVPAVLS
jgi:UDP-glucose 4-epimerase